MTLVSKHCPSKNVSVSKKIASKKKRLFLIFLQEKSLNFNLCLDKHQLLHCNILYIYISILLNTYWVKLEIIVMVFVSYLCTKNIGFSLFFLYLVCMTLVSKHYPSKNVSGRKKNRLQKNYDFQKILHKISLNFNLCLGKHQLLHCNILYIYISGSWWTKETKLS